MFTCDVSHAAEVSRVLLVPTARIAPLVGRFDETINHRNAKGETKLHLAVVRGQHDLVRQLLDNGAYADIQDYAGWTPLHEACAEGDMAMVQLLIA